MSRRICGIAGVMLIVSAVTASAQEDTFTKANNEYAAGRFPESISLYQNLVAGGAHHATIFYNLANAHYRTGAFGQAILNYERALALEPHHPEAEANLRLVRDKARALELKRSSIERAVMQLDAGLYSIMAAAGLWAAAFCLATIFLSRRRSSALIALFIISLLACWAGVYGAYVYETGSRGHALAIVTGKDTEARLATADNAGPVLTLPPGSEIKILTTRGDWLYAGLPNDLRGWIPTQSVERVRL